MGENGSGKSTIIEAIALAAGFNLEGGSKNFQFATVQREEEHPRLLKLMRAPRRPSDGYFLRAESFVNVATEIDRLGVTHGYGGTSLHEQSHGEAFMSLLVHRHLGAAHAQESIWGGRSWVVTFKHIFDSLVFGLLTAGTFGWLWPKSL